MITLPQFLDFLRSVSFGVILANTILLIAFSYFPNLFPESFTYNKVMFVASALGTMLHRVFNAVLFNPLTKELARSSAFYAKYKEAVIARNKGLLSDAEFLEYSSQLKRDYFSVVPAQSHPGGQRLPPAAPVSVTVQSQFSGGEQLRDRLDDETTRVIAPPHELDLMDEVTRPAARARVNRTRKSKKELESEGSIDLSDTLS